MMNSRHDYPPGPNPPAQQLHNVTPTNVWLKEPIPSHWQNSQTPFLNGSQHTPMYGQTVVPNMEQPIPKMVWMPIALPAPTLPIPIYDTRANGVAQQPYTTQNTYVPGSGIIPFQVYVNNEIQYVNMPEGASPSNSPVYGSTPGLDMDQIAKLVQFSCAQSLQSTAKLFNATEIRYMDTLDRSKPATQEQLDAKDRYIPYLYGPNLVNIRGFRPEEVNNNAMINHNLLLNHPGTSFGTQIQSNAYNGALPERGMYFASAVGYGQAAARNMYLNAEILKEKEEIRERVSMFRVKNKAVHDKIKLGMEEWTCTYRQIIEELLTDILWTNPVYRFKMWVSPKNMCDSLYCVKILYDNFELRLLIEEFQEMLGRCTSGKGAINLDTKPKTFMQLYGFGVLLIQALKKILTKQRFLSDYELCLKYLLVDMEKLKIESVPDTSGTLVFQGAFNYIDKDMPRRNLPKDPLYVLNYVEKHFPDKKENAVNKQRTDVSANKIGAG